MAVAQTNKHRVLATARITPRITPVPKGAPRTRMITLLAVYLTKKAFLIAWMLLTSSLLFLQAAIGTPAWVVMFVAVIAALPGLVALYFQRRDKRKADAREDSQNFSSSQESILKLADGKEERVLAKFETLLIQTEQMYQRELNMRDEQHTKEIESWSKLLCSRDEVNKQQDVLIKQLLTPNGRI